MVRTPLPPLVVASTAVLLATSVTPSGRAAAPPTAAVAAAGAVTSAGSATPSEVPWSYASHATGVVAGADPAVRPAGRAGPAVREGFAARPWGAGGAQGAGAAPVRGAAQPSTSVGARARWRWPARPRPTEVRPFRAPLTTYGAGHRGLDLGVSDGAPVLAVEDGVVTHAGLVAGRGTITVAHPGGLSSTYEPVDPTVSVGAAVVTGQAMGVLRVRAGPAHCGARACLHLGARRGATYLDPHPLLAGGRVALLPLGR